MIKSRKNDFNHVEKILDLTKLQELTQPEDTSIYERFSKRHQKVYNVPNLERGLMIIELLAKTIMGLTLTEIINHLDISKSSAFRITSTLIYKNYLQKNETTKNNTIQKNANTWG